MARSPSQNLIRQASVCLLVLTLGFLGVNVVPTALPPAHAQGYAVAGTILGLVVIAGIVYLVTRDRYGVYYRYPYGHYYAYGGYYRYHYDGRYAPYYRPWQGRFYRGPMPGAWYGDHGCLQYSPYSPRCR
ncbi:MAG TPA: hypothetical protein VJT33_14760 [bacterium]|nr:hypothetical protein [bacterium]